MIAPDALVDMVSRMVVASDVGDGVRVSTHVLYPSNGAVSVVVRGGGNEFVASDDGGALSEIASCGVLSPISERMIQGRLRNRGMRVKNGAIYSPIISLSGLPAAVVLVANASREVADWGLTRFPVVMPRNFKKDLAALLERHFRDSVKHDAPILGSSNKPHRFDNVIYLPGNRRLLVDAVVNDPSSINSRLVANLDVRMAADPLTDQIIVYDDSLKWQSSDLTLLEMGATTVAFSKAEREIVRRAA